MQVGLIPTSGILLDDSELRRPVDNRKGRRQQGSGRCVIFRQERATHSANRVTETGLVLAVDFGTPGFRSDALQR